ncbi:hypothetical protein Tsubulata_023447 [Turnera subulata]|uniref:6-phosphogluconate dehydrogenase NADP-binding domain-containing protein n=1 Tax=Turnera subulata TaxID=218843 RepID=A0A9Q0JJ86_9ROSI|nr:hypothetical protein Tsubulata_023447 [Turnera subulata]
MVEAERVGFPLYCYISPFVELLDLSLSVSTLSRDFLNKQNNLTYKCKSMHYFYEYVNIYCSYPQAITSKGASFLEAPVSGSKQPAETGQLVILAAGDKVNLICASASVSYVWLLCW